MKRFAPLLLLTAVLVAVPEPIAWTVQGVPAGPVKPGSKFNIRLVARIQEGWHLYSQKPIAEGPIPTRIWLADRQPFSLAGPIASAEPQAVHDAAFGMEVEIYEREAAFTLPIQVAAGAARGARKLVLHVSYQTCDNRICLPPRTGRVELPVNLVN